MLKLTGMTLTNSLELGKGKTVMFDNAIIGKKKSFIVALPILEDICKKNKVSLKKYRYIKFILSSDNTEKDKKYFYAVELRYK